MSQALLQAVLEHPELDAPRLAYADWCQQQDDEATRVRAEFIRGQIAVNDTGLDTLNQGGAYALQRRMGKLWETYGAAWAAPLLPFIASYSFERGFISLVKLSARNFRENGPAIFAAAPVQHADLTDVPEGPENLFASQGFSRLRSLSMDRCGLYDSHMRLLAASPRVAGIRWLSLADNHLKLGAAQAMAESPNLKLLRFAEFRGNPVDPAEQLGWDAGVLISAWLPPEGEQLEAKYGYLPWLHRNASISRFD